MLVSVVYGMDGLKSTILWCWPHTVWPHTVWPHTVWPHHFWDQHTADVPTTLTSSALQLWQWLSARPYAQLFTTLPDGEFVVHVQLCTFVAVQYCWWRLHGVIAWCAIFTSPESPTNFSAMPLNSTAHFPCPWCSPESPTNSSAMPLNSTAHFPCPWCSGNDPSWSRKMLSSAAKRKVREEDDITRLTRLTSLEKQGQMLATSAAWWRTEVAATFAWTKEQCGHTVCGHTVCGQHHKMVDFSPSIPYTTETSIVVGMLHSYCTLHMQGCCRGQHWVWTF